MAGRNLARTSYRRIENECTGIYSRFYRVNDWDGVFAAPELSFFPCCEGGEGGQVEREDKTHGIGTR